MDWQATIDWIDDMAYGRNGIPQGLFANDLRAALDALTSMPIPRPAVVQEKIEAWTWLLDTNQVPEAPAGIEGPDTGFPGGGGFSLESIPMWGWVAAGAVLLMLARKR